MQRLPVAFLALFTLLTVHGCRPEVPSEPPPPVRAKLREGTAISLVLLRTLQAGTDKVGDPVPLMVASDVERDGVVVIPKGAVVEGRVAQSRGEGTLSGLLNQPARLAVSVESVVAVDRTEVPLVAGKEQEGFALTRANTGRPDRSESIDRMLQDSEKEMVLKELEAAFRENRELNLGSAGTERLLGEVAKELGLSETEKLVAERRVSEVDRLLSEIRKGGNLTTLLTGGSSSALTALFELADLAGDVGDRLSRMLKGRTIRAYPGTPIEATVARDTTVTASRS